MHNAHIAVPARASSARPDQSEYFSQPGDSRLDLVDVTIQWCTSAHSRLSAQGHIVQGKVRRRSGVRLHAGGESSETTQGRRRPQGRPVDQRTAAMTFFRTGGSGGPGTSSCGPARAVLHSALTSQRGSRKDFVLVCVRVFCLCLRSLVCESECHVTLLRTALRTHIRLRHPRRRRMRPDRPRTLTHRPLTPEELSGGACPVNPFIVAHAPPAPAPGRTALGWAPCDGRRRRSGTPRELSGGAPPQGGP